MESWLKQGDVLSWTNVENGSRVSIIVESAEVKAFYTVVTDSEGMDFLIGNKDGSVKVERSGEVIYDATQDAERIHSES